MDNGASSYRRFLDGDDRGIAEIVGEYKDGLILYLNGYVGNIFIAEELTEDTFFRLITKKPHYAGKSSFKSWLYAIGRHVAVDFLRHHAKMRSTPITIGKPVCGRRKAWSNPTYGRNGKLPCTGRFPRCRPSIRRCFGWCILRAFPAKRRQSR